MELFCLMRGSRYSKRSTIGVSVHGFSAGVNHGSSADINRITLDFIG